MLSASDVLRDARRRAGLSQVELALRAGITQSVVSAYESGTRQPSVPTLARLVAATGYELELSLSPPDSSSCAISLKRLRQHSEKIREIAARHGLSNVRVFGSVARGDEHEGSDVDLLLDVAKEVGLFTLGRCRAELEGLLGVKVDLVPASGLKAAVADEVMAEARTL